MNLSPILENLAQYAANLESKDPYEIPLFWAKDFFRQNKGKIPFNEIAVDKVSTKIAVDKVSEQIEVYLQAKKPSLKVEKAISHFGDLVSDQIELLSLGEKERPKRELTREGSFAALEYSFNNDTRSENLPSSYALATYGSKNKP